VVVHKGNVVYVGGDFTRVTDATGVHERNHAAAFDLTTGRVLAWNPSVGGTTVSAIVVSKKAVFLGGQFTSVRGQPRKNLARVSRGGAGTLTKKFRHGANAQVRALAFSKGRLLVGGDFLRFDGRPRLRTAAVRLKAPFKLTTWAPRVQTGGVRDILATSRGVYLAGDFRKFGGKPPYQRLVLVTTKTGGLVGAFNPALPVIVYGIVQRSGTVYAAVGGPDGGRLLAVRADTGGTVWSRGLDGDGQAISVLDGVVYLGGHFNRVCALGTTGLTDCEADAAVRRRLAGFDANGNLTTWDPEGNSSAGVFALDAQGASRQLLTGGAFTTMDQGAITVRRLAVFDTLT
jgi:outer membrane protein assembly factor BamB